MPETGDFVKIGRYCQVDINGRKQSVLVAECVDDTWASYLLDRFTFGDVRVQGVPLEEWLINIAGVKWTGKEYAVNFGPFPYTPNEHSVAKLKPMLKQYGDITKMIFYADRTITIGFALGDRPMPRSRPRIPLVSNGKALGVLLAPFHIKVMGVRCCRWCPAIADDAHTPACEQNKRDRAGFERRGKRKASQLASVAKGGRPLDSSGLEVGEIDTDTHGREGRRAGMENRGNISQPDRQPRTVLTRIIA